jgi:hypothetical protein
MNDLATTMQRTTIYSDDLTNEMEALFIQIGNVGPSQMDAAMTAAANLATGLGIDLESAVTMVSKAAEGNVTTLGKYGVAIDAAKAKAEGLPAVLDAINARFGGQAQAAAETYAGKLHQLANEWDNLKEAVGRAVVEDPMLTALMTHMKEGITGVGEAAGDYTPTISDWWVKMSTNSTSLQLIVAYLNSIEAGMRAIGLETAGLRPPPPPQFKAPTDPFAGLWADAKANAEKLDETWKKQDEAATKHAEAIESMFRRISGADAAAQMRDLDTVFRRMAASGQITEAQVRAIAKEAEDLSNKGATLTPRLLDIVLATDQLSPGLNKASINFGELGTQVGIVAPKLDKVWETLNKPIPYGIGHLKDQFAALVVVSPETMLKGVQTKVIDTDKAIQNLSTSLANMAQVAPGAFGTVIGQVARLASTIDVARKAQDAYKEGKKAWDAGDSVAGIASMASGIAGIAQAAMMAVQGVKALISVFDRNKGRDAVVDFAQSFGGFDALHAQLLELGADGEKLWIKLTQGVGTNNPEQAARVIAEVEAALARQANATADVTVQTEEGAQATIETATAASAALDTVTAKLHDNAADWAVWSDAVMAAVNAAAGAVVQMPVPGPPSAVPGFASGTGGKYLNFGSGTLAMLHGRERVSVPGEGGGGGGTAIIQLNGRTLAEVVVPEMPGVITRYGLARG